MTSPPCVVASPPERPLLVWDGECSFCRLWIARWKELTGDHVDYEVYQNLEGRFPELGADDFARAVHLIEPNGTVTSGAEAVCRALSLGGRRWPLRIYGFIPGARPLADFAYKVIARHRGLALRATKLLWGPDVTQPGFDRTVTIYIRCLGATYLVAFLSLWVQVQGLIGSLGISPASIFLDRVWATLGWQSLLVLPTLGWINASDFTLHVLCAAGVISSILLMVGIAPRVQLLWLWADYLSLVILGQSFFYFQWDMLLLEAGLLSAFLVPGTKSLYSRPTTSKGARLLLWWLLFRLMFQSGMVKLGSGDPLWSSLNALGVHFETQPWPTWIGWWAAKLPTLALHVCVFIMFVIELGFPFLILAPRRIRHLAGIVFILFQVAIALTGNYGFFNLLTIALSILLFDDRFWGHAAQPREQKASRTRPWLKVIAGSSALAYVVISTAQTLTVVGAPGLERALAPITDRIAPLRSINRYGLFAVMTQERPEIEIDGSDDQTVWRTYEFRYKAGPLTDRPALFPGHMPRLDWNMWFAALGGPRQHPWFLQLEEALLKGRPAVCGLLKTNPFPDTSPRYIRTTVYRYHFTSREQKAATGAWWWREELGALLPVLTLHNGQLQAAPDMNPSR